MGLDTKPLREMVVLVVEDMAVVVVVIDDLPEQEQSIKATLAERVRVIQLAVVVALARLVLRLVPLMEGILAVQAVSVYNWISQGRSHIMLVAVVVGL